MTARDKVVSMTGQNPSFAGHRDSPKFTVLGTVEWTMSKIIVDDIMKPYRFTLLPKNVQEVVERDQPYLGSGLSAPLFADHVAGQFVSE